MATIEHWKVESQFHQWATDEVNFVPAWVLEERKQRINSRLAASLKELFIKDLHTPIQPSDVPQK